MTVLEQRPLTLVVPVREDLPGVLRVGQSRVLLDLVIRAYQRGASPQEIVRMYDTLEVSDVFAVIAYYITHPSEIEEYVQKCDRAAEEIRRKLESSQPPGPTKDELLARAKAQGLKLRCLRFTAS